MKHFLALISLAATLTTSAADKPNIIYILADDLGINDFGCYGQEIIKTPRIDQMAKEGMQFFNHYSGSTVCAPTRSCLMTGQHTGRTRIRGNAKAHLKPEDITVAEVLKKAGYATGCVGKWGLGEAGTPGIPNKQGFDFFFGYLNQSRAHRFYPDYIWRNEEKEYYPENSTKRETYIHDSFTNEGLKWIEEQSKTDKPFFLYAAYTLSHVDLDVPDDSMAPYLQTIEEKGPYKNPNAPKKGYRSHPTPRACFAGMTSRLDRDVGKILDLVDRLGIADNTLIMFSSDNGPTPAGGADPNYFDGNGIYRGIKRDLYEGGIRAPFIARWPGKIKSGSRSNHISTHWDLMATVAELTQSSPANDHTGISFLPSLLGKGSQRAHDYLYWEFYEQGGKQAIRKGGLKAVRLNRMKTGPSGPWEIYDLSSDPGESTNLARRRPELQATFNKIANEAATESALFSWKTRGGKNKKK
ncbi:arylsulfatase [Akkermansiaceae bacterium]|nr:arylsulfatase [Akkermansiaceae bacterium]